jgi:hypothetical protein
MTFSLKLPFMGRSPRADAGSLAVNTSEAAIAPAALPARTRRSPPGLSALKRRLPERLRRARISAPAVQAPVRFEQPLIKSGEPQLLELGSEDGPKLQMLLEDMANLLGQPDHDPTRVQRALSTFSTSLSASLGKVQTSDSIRLAFELSDGAEALNHLKRRVMAKAPDGHRDLVQSRLESFDTEFFWHFDQAVRSPRAQVDKRSDETDLIESILLNGERYAFQRLLGSGGYGQAVLYRNEQGKGVVVKIPYSNRERERSIDIPAREARAMVTAMGAGGGGADRVTPLLGTIRDKEGLLIITPYAEFGDLHSVRMALLHAAPTARRAAALFKLTLAHDIIMGARRLQVKGVSHGDLKRDNCLVDDQGRCRISDLGLSQSYEQAGLMATAALPNDPDLESPYAAPEYVRGEPATMTPAFDSYQVGAMLFELVYSDYLLGGPGGLTSPDKKKYDPDRDLPAIAPEDWPGVDTTALRQLIAGLLQVDPKQRLSLEKAADCTVFADPAIGSRATRSALVDELRKMRPSA